MNNINNRELKMTLSPLCSITLATLLLSPLAALADPAERADTIAPFVDEQTIAIARVDFGRVDVEATLKRIRELAPGERIAAHLATPPIQGLLNKLRESGVDVYVVLSLADLPKPGPFLIAKGKPGSDVKETLEVLSTLRTEVSEHVGDVVFLGPASTLKRIQAGRPSPRPAIARAFEAAGDTDAQILFVPSADQRRVIAEMLPQLPEEAGGGSGKSIADIEWATIAINSPPEFSVDATVQSKNEESARALKSTLTAMFWTLSRNKAVKEKLPKVADLVDVVTPKIEGRRLSLQISDENGNLPKLLAALSAPLGSARNQAQRRTCVNNLKYLALSWHNYHDVHAHFPASASRDDDGKELLSWRVHVLPFLGQLPLYNEFHLDEPWDSEHNKKLIAKMPDAFACPGTDLKAAGKTTYLTTIGEHGLFRGDEGIRVRDIRDGTSNTIMIVDVAPEKAVVWTKPGDLEVDPEAPLRGLGGQHDKVISAAFCDGSVHSLAQDIKPTTLKLLFNPDDGKPIPSF
jgi:hypothetical protein